jgi:hypothetical protein
MKLKSPYILVLILAIILMSCSTDDNNSIPDENINKFTFNNETYDLVSAIISDDDSTTDNADEIEIRLFNKTSSEITSNVDLDDITFVYFKIQDTDIQQTTYNQLEDYSVSIDGSVLESEFNYGTFLLSNNDSESDIYAESASITVTNFTTFNIDFIFTFTRNDGQVISGRYNGSYFQPNSNG